MYMGEETGLPKAPTPTAGQNLELTVPGPDLATPELFKMAVDLLRREETSEAIKLLKKVCELDGDNAQAHAFLGAALAEELQIDEAQAELDLALKLNSQDAFVQLKAGELMLLLGRTPEALKHLELAFKLPPPSPETRFYIATLMQQTRHHRKNLVSRENRLVGRGALKAIRQFFTRSKRPAGVKARLSEQNRGEI